MINARFNFQKSNSVRKISPWLCAIYTSGLCVSCVVDRPAVTNIYLPIPSDKPFSENFRANSISIHFEGETVPFEYNKLGLAAVRLAQSTPVENGFSHLQNLAWKKGGDALIAVKKENLQVVQWDNATSSTFTVPVFKGIVVKRILSTSSTDSSIAAKMDTSFLQAVNRDKKNRQEDMVRQEGGIFVLTVIGIALLVTVLVAKKASSSQ